MDVCHNMCVPRHSLIIFEIHIYTKPLFYLNSNLKTLDRILWILIMVGGVTVSVWLAYQTYIAWMEDPVLTTGRGKLEHFLYCN